MKEELELKDFPIKYDKGKFFTIKGEELKYSDNFIDKLLLCANYGKRALLRKKMQTFPDMSLNDAEFLVSMSLSKEGYILCLPEETEYQFTIKVIDSKNIKVKPLSKVLNFKKK